MNNHCVYFIQQLNYIHTQQLKIDNLENVAEKQETVNKDLKDKDTQIMDILNRPAHTETGSIQCGDSTTWTGQSQDTRGGIWRYHKDVTQSFKTKYNHTPVVYTSVGRYYTEEDNHAIFGVDLVSVTQDNFTVRCRGHVNSGGNRIYQMDIHWMSLEQYHNN